MIQRRPPAGLTLLLFGALTAAACGGAEAGPTPPSIDTVAFVDVAAETGLDFEHGAFRFGTGGDPAAMMGGGVCWIDYDADGWLDLFAVNTWSDGQWSSWQDAGGLPSSRLYRNDRGSFVDVTTETGAGLEIRGNGCVAADLDADGFTDLYVTSDRANVLLWNEAGSRFVDGSAAAGVDASGWHTGAAAGDLDGDGRVDLYVAGYANTNRTIPEATKGFPNNYEAVRDLVLMNRGSSPGARPTFHEVGADVGIEIDQVDYGLGVIVSDIDDDGDLDVFVANDTQPNRLYLNTPSDSSLGFGFDEVGAVARVDDDNAGMGIAAGDFDGDERPDLVVTNLGEQLHNLWRSDGPGSGFADARVESGLPDFGSGLTGWGTCWFDADLDGDLDLWIAHGAIPVLDLVEDRQPVHLYAQEPDGTLKLANERVGLDAVAPLVGRGSAAADYDNDGDIDVAVSAIGSPIALLENQGATGRWLSVAPQPAPPGTVVEVQIDEAFSQRHELLAGSSYLSSEDPRAHFGLGTADEVDRIVVRWPDGAEQVLENADADQLVVVAHP